MLGLVRRIGDGPPNLLKAMSTIFTTHNLSSLVLCCKSKLQKHCCFLGYLGYLSAGNLHWQQLIMACLGCHHIPTLDH